MSEVRHFGDLHFRTISPDEIASLARAAVKLGLTQPAEAVLMRGAVRAALPVLGELQLPMVLDGFRGADLDAEWAALRDQIAARLN